MLKPTNKVLEEFELDNTMVNPSAEIKKRKKKNGVIDQIKNQRYLMVLLVPCLLYYVVFKYIPMYGIIIGFKDYDFSSGIFGSPWVGLKHFMDFFNGPYFLRLIVNTFLLSFYDLLWGFPAPIIFAILLNEVENKHIKKSIQTISYLPHFISVVILVGLLQQIVSPSTGVINKLIVQTGNEAINFFMKPEWFRTLYISSGIWQNLGWNTIIYMAALAGIDSQLYEAAKIDGAGRFRCMINVTLPGLAPTIVVLLILRLGNLLNVGFEKALLMQNPSIYDTADIISTYVYRAGIQNASYSFGTAVGFFNSLIALILIITSNTISKKLSETSLW